MEGALALIHGALERPGTPWDRLYWLVTEVLTRAHEDPEAYMIIVQAYVSEVVPERARSMAIQYTMSSSQTIRELIVQGQAAGQVIAGDPAQLAATFTACLQGLALSAASPIRQASGSLDVGAVLRMLRAQADAPRNGASTGGPKQGGTK
jgi:hypothetical protein